MGYVVDASRIVFERLDDELTIIDLATGNYYGVLGAGIDVWEALGAGCSLEGGASLVSTRYDVTPSVAEQATQAFVAELLAAGLLVEQPGGTEPPSDASVLESRPWSPPVLETYSDMQDFLMLDPIHEVDPTLGWPRPASS